MKAELTVSRWDLFTIFNSIYRNKIKQVKILVPYLKYPLFEIAVQQNRAQIKLNYKQHEYNKEIEQYRFLRAFQEIPDFSSVKEVIIQSGILEYSNLTELLAELHRACQWDYIKGERPVYMALDTNLMRDRFYSTQHAWLETLPQNKIGFSISPYIKGELDFTRCKYKQGYLSQLKKACVHPVFHNYYTKFFNQNCLNERKRRLGYLEFEKVHRLQWVIMLPTLDEDELQENGDQNIILNYQKAAEDRNLNVFLLSRDSDFIARAEGIVGIHPFLLETPALPDSPLLTKDWYQLSQFFYCMAVHFGMIRVETQLSKMILLGIWSGKKPGDWKKENLILHFDTTQTVAEKLFIQLVKLRELKWEYE